MASVGEREKDRVSSTSRNENGWTALHAAAFYGRRKSNFFELFRKSGQALRGTMKYVVSMFVNKEGGVGVVL